MVIHAWSLLTASRPPVLWAAALADSAVHRLILREIWLSMPLSMLAEYRVQAFSRPSAASSRRSLWKDNFCRTVPGGTSEGPSVSRALTTTEPLSFPPISPAQVTTGESSSTPAGHYAMLSISRHLFQGCLTPFFPGTPTRPH